MNNILLNITINIDYSSCLDHAENKFMLLLECTRLTCL